MLWRSRGTVEGMIARETKMRLGEPSGAKGFDAVRGEMETGRGSREEVEKLKVDRYRKSERGLGRWLSRARQGGSRCGEGGKAARRARRGRNY